MSSGLEGSPFNIIHFIADVTSLACDYKTNLGTPGQILTYGPNRGNSFWSSSNLAYGIQNKGQRKPESLGTGLVTPVLNCWFCQSGYRSSCDRICSKFHDWPHSRAVTKCWQKLFVIFVLSAFSLPEMLHVQLEHSSSSITGTSVVSIRPCDCICYQRTPYTSDCWTGFLLLGYSTCSLV